MNLAPVLTLLVIVCGVGAIIAVRQNQTRKRREVFSNLKATYDRALETVIKYPTNPEAVKICVETGKDFYERVLLGGSEFIDPAQIMALTHLVKSEDLMLKKIQADLKLRYEMVRQMALAHAEPEPAPLDLVQFMKVATDPAKAGTPGGTDSSAPSDQSDPSRQAA